MANRATTKLNFETGDKPTQGQFGSWIDSVYFFDDDTSDDITQGSINLFLTSGDQTFVGIKTFGSFPITPSSAPTTDFQVANKKYVDDSAGGAGNPGGADTTIQFNDGGSFGGFWSYDKVNDKIIAPTGGSPANPMYAFGDGDSGFYEPTDDTIAIAVSGVRRWNISGSFLSGVAGGAIHRQAPTATFPTVIPSINDTNTGIGSAAADQLSLIAGGVEGFRVEEASSGTVGTHLFIPDLSTAPSFNPTAGGYLYTEAGAVKYRGSSGTVTTIAIA